MFFLLSVKKLRPPPPSFLITSVFCDKEFFDSAHSPFGQKKSEYFLIRIFWIGRDSPSPFSTESKKISFLSLP